MRRRTFLRYLSAATLAAAAGRLPGRAPSGHPPPRPLRFTPVPPVLDGTHHVAPGYRAEVLLRWGDPLAAGLPPWRPGDADPAGRMKRFGYNNDFIAYFPLPDDGARHTRGLLCVNHEYPSTRFMWPGLPRRVGNAMTAERTAAEQAAVGHSVVEIHEAGGRWRVAPDSPFNRRQTGTSPCTLSGPAAGHPRLRTGGAPDGRITRGILGACAGGRTPWGTVLIGEENFQHYFSGVCADARERANHARYGVGRDVGFRWWARHDAHFDLAREPRGPNGYGWVVEIDPYDAAATPIKRTALGRFRHEGASCAIGHDGRVAVYSGDDAPFEYLYKFVTRGGHAAGDRKADRHRLDEGTLHVARFADDGRLTWLPLVHGRGPLTPANGFADQGDVLIEARRAADLLGATRLDRPEDVEADPATGVVYALLTGHPGRRRDAVDAANPRAGNPHGHILALYPPGAPGTAVDHAADEFGWQVWLLAGDPAAPGDGARYPGAVDDASWISGPDNCAFDPAGRLWIATDQGYRSRQTGRADGLFGCTLAGPGLGALRCLFRAPIGAEVCGPEFTSDGRTLFLAIQHPGVDGVDGASYERPGTRWPDFDEAVPPRPSVMAITREDGGIIGD